MVNTKGYVDLYTMFGEYTYSFLGGGC